MAEITLKVGFKRGWLLRRGLIGAFVVLVLLKCGAPAKWFYRLDVG